jgi:hypothetical protein
VTPQRATRPHALLLLAVVSALVLTMIGPGTRTARALPDLPPVLPPTECMVPSRMPQCLFLHDTRPPQVVFEEGFTPAGTNRLLGRHLETTGSAQSDSIFINTFRDPAISHALETEGWVYMVSSSDRYFSVNNSLAEFTAASAATGDATRAQLASDLLDYIRPLDTWVSAGPIPGEQVLAAVRQPAGGGPLDMRLMERNEGGVMLRTTGSTGVYGINGTELDAAPACLSPLTARTLLPSAGGTACALPQTEEELAAFHEGFAGEVEDVAFTPLVEDLARGDDLKLAPLRDTNELLASFDAASGAEGVEALRASLTEALPREAQAFHALTTDETLISKVMAKAGRTVDIGSELIPYVGLAATGYALRADIEDDDWVDAGFDSVALVLQLIEAAQPELAVFVEPLLIADLVAQWAVDHFRPEAPAPPPADLRHLYEAIDEWDAAADVIEPSQTRASAQHLGDGFAAVRQQHVHDVLDTRLAADLQTLDRIRYGYVLGTLRQTRTQMDENGELPDDVRAHETAMLTTVNTTFAGLAQERTEQYREAADAQVLAAFDHAVAAWQPGDPQFDAFHEQFEQRIAFEHLVPIESTLFAFLRDGRTGGPFTYPAVCRTSIAHGDCVAARRAAVTAEAQQISELHQQRLRDPAWAAGARAYVAGATPDAAWPDDYLTFTTLRTRGPSPEKACSSGRFTSPDGWQRSTIQVCAQSVDGTRLTYTAHSRGEYFWGGAWYENDRPVRIRTHIEVRDAGSTLVSGTTTRDGTPWCMAWIGCTPIHPTTGTTLDHTRATSGLVVTFSTDVTGMYWSTNTRTNPGISDISGARQSVYIPATAVARIDDPVVRSVRKEGDRLAVGLDATAFGGDNRFIVTVDGQYVMEAHAGRRYYSFGTTSESTAGLWRTQPDLGPGSRVEVLLSTGRPGQKVSPVRSLATLALE